MRPLRLARLALLLFLCAPTSPASAFVFGWTNAAGGAYTTPGNWSGFGTTPMPPPTWTDDVRWNLPGAAFTVHSFSAGNHSCAVQGGDVTFDLGGNAYNCWFLGMSVSSSGSPNAVLRIRNGTLNGFRYVTVGGSAGLDVQGPTSAVRAGDHPDNRNLCVQEFRVGSGTSNTAWALVHDGAFVRSGCIIIQSSGVIFGATGRLIGNGTHCEDPPGTPAACVVRNYGSLFPGVFPLGILGDMTVQNADYEQFSTGRLGVSIVSPALGDYDRLLVVGGQAFLDGDLYVSPGGGYTEPPIGASFTILEADGGITGTFASVTLPPLSAGKRWVVVYLAHRVDLKVARKLKDPVEIDPKDDPRRVIQVGGGIDLEREHVDAIVRKAFPEGVAQPRGAEALK